MESLATVDKWKVLTFIMRQVRGHFDTFLNSTTLAPASYSLTAIVKVFSDCSLNLIHMKSLIRVNFQHILQQLAEINRIYIADFPQERL